MDTNSAGFYYQGGPIGVYLVHGLTGTPTEMQSVGKRLHKFGFTVYCPVLAGHCGTEDDLRATNWHDWAASAEEGLLKFREQVEVVFAGGISAGAVLSLYLADRHPDLIRGLALYSTTLKWDGWSIPRLCFILPLLLRLPIIGPRYHFAEAYPYGIKNEGLRRRLVTKMKGGDVVAAGHTHTPGFIIRELWRLVAAVEKRFGSIKTPALIAHAVHDDIAGLRRNALYIRDRLAGPTSLLPLYDSYHMITVDQERQKVADSTARFFRDQLDEHEMESLAGECFPDGQDQETITDQFASWTKPPYRPWTPWGTRLKGAAEGA